MNKKKSLYIASAVCSALSFAAAAATGASAADPVKCYGIAKAGENDCTSKGGKTSCKGSASTDYSPNDYKLVKDEASCTAAIQAVKDATLKKQ